MQSWSRAAALGLVVLGAGALSAARPPSAGEPTPIHGATAGDQFGVALACCDLDGDKLPETLIGARDADPNGITDAGSVFIYSGRTGQLLRRLDGTTPSGVFGASLACADLNGDKRPDVLVGIPNQGVVRVFSGRDFTIIRETQFQTNAFQTGFSVAAADVNGDRVPDIVAGAPNFSRAGSGAGVVVVYSGKDGSVLHRFDGTQDQDQFGSAVAAADIDRDGFADIVAGAGRTDVDGVTDAGAVSVFSGRNGARLRYYEGAGTDELLGISVAVGDLNHDKYPDVLAGAPNRDPNGITDAGSILAFSGKTGQLLREFNGGFAGEHMGWGLACGKIDKDAFPDVAAGGIQGVMPPTGAVEKVQLFSGKTGARFFTLERPAAGGNFGLRLALCGKGKGPATRLLVGEQQADPGGKVDAGTVWSYPLKAR